jgi:hypothetical protein
MDSKFVVEVWDSFYKQVKEENWPEEKTEKVRQEIMNGIIAEMEGKS